MNESPETDPRHWFVFGEAVPPPSPLPLRAGPLRLLYEPDTGSIRYIRLGEHEVLRRIYAAVRDQNWATIPAAISEMSRSITPDSFEIQFEAVHRQDDIHFTWQGSISGQPDGTLFFGFDGGAQSTFFRNRIGLCVLYPIRECVGAAARQKRTDGSVIECRFPERIEPQLVGRSPFRNLQELCHQIGPGIWAELRFDGEVFEMEDQRNWTDASFKTYGTPLELPFPVQINAGTAVKQQVVLRLMGHAQGADVGADTPAEATPVVDLSLREAGPMHALNIGVGLASHSQPLTVTEASRLRVLHLRHLRVDIRLADPNWRDVWERALREAAQLGTRLELALHLPPHNQVAVPELRRVLLANCDCIDRILALGMGEPATSPATLAAVRQVFAGSSLPIGAGTDANFCELNREQALGRVPVAEADFLFWPMNPQVHAADSRSIFETIEAQPDSLRTARAFAPGKPLVISPVTLKPRFNAVATTADSPGGSNPLPPSVDPRQVSLFAAAWTLASLAALAAAGAASVTLFETTGWRGVIERDAGSPWQANMPQLRGQVFPVYHPLALLAEAGSFWPYPPEWMRAWAALTVPDRNGRARVLLTNLKAQPQLFHLTGATAAHVHVLDHQSVSRALHNPELFGARPAVRNQERGFIELQLPAYALALITSSNLFDTKKAFCVEVDPAI